MIIVFDMAGTTVRDHDEVLHCFREACRQSGITATDQQLNALMGVSKLRVFQMLWREQIGDAPDLVERADAAYTLFRNLLEDYYRTNPVVPTEGTPEVFAWCRANGIKIALNTGFYRKVTDLLLEQLGWREGDTVDMVISSDQVPDGRPAPYMIRAIMAALGEDDPKQVVKIGDTPVDIAEGRNAECRYTLVVTNGTHTHAELAQHNPDALLTSLAELPAWLEAAAASGK
jgi:phosphonatase-like hydrolase